MLTHALLCATLALGALAAPTFYVDCGAGSDAGGGTAASPWRTLGRAQAAVRPAPAGATVLIRGDCFPVDASGAFDGTGAVLSLGPVDSGAPGAPVTWAAWPGASARLLGGVAIPAAAWAPAGAAAPVPGTLMADLGAGGVDAAKWGLGSLAGGGLGQCVDTMAELFFNGAPQYLARFPNVDPSSGAWEWLEISRVMDKENTFVVNGTGAEHALQWGSAASSPGGAPWVHGFWSYDWADSYTRVKSVTSDGQGGAEITIDPSTPPVYGFLPKARFMGVNILSELDFSGEYFIDQIKEVIYWMPPPGGVQADDEVFLSVAHTLVNTSSAGGSPVANVAFSGLQALYARSTGFALEGVENVTLTGITSALHGHTGVSLVGTGLTLRDSLIFGTGCAAATVTGGDVAKLLPSGNLVANNTMHDYARIIRTYNPGLGWFGAVGQTMVNNTFRNAPHNGMLGGGALNLVQGNVFDTLLYEATDSGAFYVGYSWTNRGNVVRGNTFRNIRATEKTTLGYPSVQCVEAVAQRTAGGCLPTHTHTHHTHKNTRTRTHTQTHKF